MSHNNSILNILRIKDKNIKIISVEEAEHSSSVTSSTISIFFWGGINEKRCGKFTTNLLKS